MHIAQLKAQLMGRYNTIVELKTNFRPTSPWFMNAQIWRQIWPTQLIQSMEQMSSSELWKEIIWN